MSRAKVMDFLWGMLTYAAGVLAVVVGFMALIEEALS